MTTAFCILLDPHSCYFQLPLKVAVAALQVNYRLNLLPYVCDSHEDGEDEDHGNVKDSIFIHNIFCNWMDVTRCFSGHEDSANHKTSVDSEVVITLPMTTGYVGEMLSSTLPAQSTLTQVTFSY